MSKNNKQPYVKTGWNRPVQFGFNKRYSSSGKANHSIITASEDLKKSEEYETVSTIIENLISTGLSKMGEGYCISVSDIIYNILSQNKIKCHLMEVQLSIVDQKTNETRMIGYETSFHQNSHEKVNTHVVVVTDTKIPMLIDLSIAHRLPGGYQAVVEKAEDVGDKVLTTFEFENTGFIYQEKKQGIGIPSLHQVSILDRMATDQKIFQEVKQLKMLNFIGIGVSIFALVNVLLKVFDVF